MSDDVVSTRAGIAEAITASLEESDKAENAPAPVETAAAVAPVSEPQAASPAPVAEEATPAITLTDKSLVPDPATGEMRPWGEIKAERLRFADYTKKAQALAQERRQIEADRAAFAAQQAALQAKQAASALPELPDDDPYALRIKAVEEQTRAYLAAQQAQQQALESERIAVAASRLDADEQRARTDLGLDDTEMDIVGRTLLAKLQSGEQVGMMDVAKQFVAYRNSREEAAVKRFKEQHRVGAPAAATVTPGAGPKEQMPTPGTRAHRDWVRDNLVSLMS